MTKVLESEGPDNMGTPSVASDDYEQLALFDVKQIQVANAAGEVVINEVTYGEPSD